MYGRSYAKIKVWVFKSGTPAHLKDAGRHWAHVLPPLQKGNNPVWCLASGSQYPNHEAMSAVTSSHLLCFGTVVLEMKTLGFPGLVPCLAHRENLGVFTIQMDPRLAQVRFRAGVYMPVRECWGQQWQRWP